MRTYREQFERVERFLDRVRRKETDTVEYMDDLWAFFQNAWHLKDWVKYDSSIPKDKSGRIIKAAEASDVIQICADLANRSKHLALTRKDRKGADVTGRNITIVIGGNTSSKITHNVGLNDGSVVIAQYVAEQIVVEWAEILTKEGLK